MSDSETSLPDVHGPGPSSEVELDVIAADLGERIHAWFRSNGLGKDWGIKPWDWNQSLEENARHAEPEVLPFWF